MVLPGQEESQVMDVEYWSFGELGAYALAIKGMQEDLVTGQGDRRFGIIELEELLLALRLRLAKRVSLALNRGSPSPIIALGHLDRYIVGSVRARGLLEQTFRSKVSAERTRRISDRD